jgi:hypothetical protein
MPIPLSPKISKDEASKRVRVVYEWILQGYSTCDIIRQICGQWRIGERAAYNIHKKAWGQLQEVNKRTLEEKKAYHIELRVKMLRDLKFKTEPNGARAALRIADSMAKIDGVIPKSDPKGWANSGDDSSDKKATLRLPDGTEIEL